MGLIDSDKRTDKNPEFAAERCVHTQIVNASCQACVDVCHASAWQIDDEQLGIDPDLCDNCGICAAVCPQDAIEHSHNPLSIRWHEETLALIACEKISATVTDHSTGIISCIHALSIRDLLKLYASGHHRVLVCTEKCVDCKRTPALDAQLEGRLRVINNLLKLRGQSPLEAIDISAEQWLNIIRSADHTNSGKSLSRRHFLRQAASELSAYGLRRFELRTPGQATPPPIAKLLPVASTEQALPYVPHIDVQRCTACDTCIKLCPHDALALKTQNDHSAYVIEAQNCSNCGICIDVCRDQAISIKRNIVASQKRISLYTHNCAVCAQDFNSIDVKSGQTCSICQQKKHSMALFQVLD